MSKIEDSVCEKLQTRAEIGLKKYNTTMERDDLTELEWLVHFQEELMDGCVYVEKIIQRKQNEKEVFEKSDIYKKNVPI
jgi:hypothetical protein